MKVLWILIAVLNLVGLVINTILFVARKDVSYIGLIGLNALGLTSSIVLIRRS